MSRIAGAFFRVADETPTRTALIFERRRLSFAELARLAARWSTALARNGVCRGDRIGVILPNGVDFVALILASADLGTALAPLNVSHPPDAIRKAFVASGVRHVIGLGSTLDLLAEARTTDFGFADGLWLAVDESKCVRTLRELLASTPPEPPAVLQGTDDDALILTMTSGSTGDPKAIVLTQRTKWNRAQAAIELYGVTERDVTLAATPLYHSLAERLVLIPLLTGGTSVLMRGFTAGEWLRTAQEQGVTFTIAVSSQLSQIADELERDGRSVGAALRCVVSSSAPIDTATKLKLLNHLHCDFHECYGTSEIAIATNLDSRNSAAKLSSVGKPAPGVDIKILNEDDEPLSVGEPGEIVCSTPMLFGGYLDRPDLTRRSMWGDYFRTGDIGRMDEDGYLHFLGRKKEIIISGGINIYPTDVEAALAEHPSVAESAAFALPDSKLGEVLAVALVPRDADKFDLRSLRFHCAKRLADYQQPRKFYVLPSLPKNPMGKIMKQALVSKFGGTST